jgi:hypothetical protein
MWYVADRVQDIDLFDRVSYACDLNDESACETHVSSPHVTEEWGDGVVIEQKKRLGYEMHSLQLPENEFVSLTSPPLFLLRITAVPLFLSLLLSPRHHCDIRNSE